MKKLKFEHKIIIVYLIVGSIWILFSDQLLNIIIDDIDLLTKVQTFKGWSYVIITGILFFMILKTHLAKLRIAEEELKIHRNNLQKLVDEKTEILESTIDKLRAINEELKEKNIIINNQNQGLKNTLQHLKVTQEQLFQAEKMASLGVLTAGVSHELNNPLNYILGGITGLENYFNEQIIDKNICLFVNSIKTGVDRASSIVSRMNQLTGSKGKDREDCYIHAIIENCLKSGSELFINNIILTTNFIDEDIIVFGNYDHLHQAIMNILINARQSIKKEGSISIITKKEEENVLIQVTDTGCGISKDNLPKVTDPFFTTKQPGQGAGIGLSIAYYIIYAHKGNINFHSEESKGTIVTISLPVKSN